MHQTEEWAKSLLQTPDSSSEWTVVFHDLLTQANTELARYDAIMAQEHP